MSSAPSTAQVVIIGGGIIGCSTAYHLAKLGFKDIVLLERAKLTSGSTWHAAGLVGQLRTSANVTQLLNHSVALYDTLEAETGQATGWKRNGGLRLACNKARLTEIRRQATFRAGVCWLGRRWNGARRRLRICRRRRVCGRWWSGS